MFLYFYIFCTDEEETTTEATEAADEGKSYLLNLHVTIAVIKCRSLILRK
jgi:hypothetical protein